MAKDGRGALPRWTAAAALTVAAAGLPALVFGLAHRGEPFWWDEVFSLWASDPTVPLGAAFTGRILPDSNPPGYFTLLYLARLIAPDDDAAVLGLNLAALAAVVGLVLHRAAAVRRLPAAVLAVAVFLLGGPVLATVDEARAYGPGLALVLLAADRALGTADGETPPSAKGMALIGAACALVHVFAAIAAGALAAAGGLVTLREARRRWPALLALGGTASAVTAIWSLAVPDAAARIAWIHFDAYAVAVALGEAGDLVFGDRRLAVLAALGLAAGLADRDRRRVAAAGLLAVALFLLLPLAASYVRPLVTARYLILGGPIAVVALARVVLSGPMPTGRGRLALALPAAAALAAIAVLGLPAARQWRAATAFWSGGAVVRDLLAGTAAPPARVCPPGSIATNGPLLAVHDAAWRDGLSRAAGLPADRFRIARAGPPAVPAPGCPVIGWVEHVFGGTAALPDAGVLALLSLPPDTPHGAIRRTGSGYVVPAPP